MSSPQLAPELRVFSFQPSGPGSRDPRHGLCGRQRPARRVRDRRRRWLSPTLSAGHRPMRQPQRLPGPRPLHPNPELSRCRLESQRGLRCPPQAARERCFFLRSPTRHQDVPHGLRRASQGDRSTLYTAPSPLLTSPTLSVLQVLGCLAMIDDGETDWKVPSRSPPPRRSRRWPRVATSAGAPHPA